MTPQELVSIIKAHRRDSLGYEDGELSTERAVAMDHYHGRPYGNEVVGRSQVVSRDLAETVDWAMPTLMRSMVQSGNIAEFDPVGEEDEEQAQQESDYVHQVIMKDNGGIMLIHDTLKEALLLKNCYAKHWWATEKTVRRESYTGLTMDQITQMLGEMKAEGIDYEIAGQSSEFVEIPGFGPMEFFDLRLKVKREAKRLRVDAVPVEELRVSKKCRGSLQDSPFTEHVTKKTRSELKEMGMDHDFVDGLPAYGENDSTDTQSRARDTVMDEGSATGSSIADRSMDEIEYCEAYVKVDFDGDGIAELRKVVTVADKIPEGEEWNTEIEACAITGGVIKRVPHRHVGESLDDELADLQEIKTALERQLMDNVYATNNNQWMANERVNLKDLMSNITGGIKRISGKEPIGDSLVPVMTPSIVDKLLPVIQHFNTTKEVRSGIRPGSDMDPDILRETTKGAFLEHLNRASQKIELIARLYAESFLKELMIQSHGLLVRHQDTPRKVKMRGKWTEVNPREWSERTDLTVRVGLGTGNEEEKRQKLMMLTQLQGPLLQAAGSAPPPVYSKMYALFSDVSKAMGFDIPEKYAIAPPPKQEGEQEGNDYAMVQQAAKSQPNPEMMKVQAQAQSDMAKMQMDAKVAQMQAQMQAEVDRNRQEMEARQQQAKTEMEMRLDQQKHAMEMQFEREKAAQNMQLQLILARMNNAAKLDMAQIAADTTLTAQQEGASDAAASD